jgi:dihydrofolate reductase
VDWQNSELLEGEAADAIARLKEQDGPELQVHGSGSLIQTLLKNNLIDEMHIHIFPVVVGKGKRLFADGTVPEGLKLTKSSISKTGVIVTTYLPAGDLKTGTFG